MMGGRPFELLWQPNPSLPATRVHSELYNSDAFLKAHRDLQNSPRPPGCNRPRVVVGLMFWSDATHMTSFSDAKLWPCYMGFANDSKYRRCKPTSDLIHQVAYFDSVSTSFKDYATQRGDGKLPPNPFMSHCRSEAMHAQWRIILDEELLDAINNGLIECRFYIRIFTYSADYPERVLIATIRQRGDCPCTRCSVKHRDRPLGTAQDRLRREEKIRRDDNARRSLALLKSQSLQPIENAFIVDLLHEFEIGVWKGLFTHLMRIVEACGLVVSSSMSWIRGRPARDYEDVLQVGGREEPRVQATEFGYSVHYRL
ncbi:hypothetical protein FA13DRAFT_1758237 [Coprinellus micaceus]|uniref:Uncharacterized protein n=1 Tax=Coprinellus micaceus TaxID=71717 RepID=A0A4Y7SC85_COPMI|nr:hypothetical protein FA13DRAFT_1758237 [Coprinellus micaceus]